MRELRGRVVRALSPARWPIRLSAWMLGAALALPFAPDAAAQSRGELLYENSCKACHDEQVHWREQRLVTDWSSLEAQVRRWQAVGRLSWSDDDIRDVTRYLNEQIYHFEPRSQTLTEWRGDARAVR